MVRAKNYETVSTFVEVMQKKLWPLSSGHGVDKGKVTMEGLQELTNALSNGTIPDPIRPPVPQDWGSQPNANLQSLLFQERVKPRTSNLAGTLSEQKPIKNFGEKRAWMYPETAHFFLSTTYYFRNG